MVYRLADKKLKLLIGLPMIKKIKLQNFKLFKNIEINNIEQITLIGGANNTGKTSLLEAIFMFYDRANPDAILRQFSWRGVTSIPLKPDTMWAPFFFGYKLENPIKITIWESKNKKSTLCLTYNPAFQPSSINIPPLSSFSEKPNFNTDLKKIPSFSLDLEYQQNSSAEWNAHLIMEPDKIKLLSDHISQIPCAAVFLGSNRRVKPNEDANRFGELDIVGRQELVIEILKTIEPKLIGLSTIALGETSLIHGDIGRGRKIPVAFMGEGTSKLLSIILAIATNENGVLLIDEIENGIHYSVMSKIWEVISRASVQFNCQIVATTHSYECLKSLQEGVPEEFSDKISYIRLDKTGDTIIAKNYNHKTLGAAISRGWEVR